MPNDERKGRRLGDETKGRIAELASGWTVEGHSLPAPPVPEAALGRRESPVRATQGTLRPAGKTQPPPPPGSPERRALEDRIAEFTDEVEADDDEEIIDASLWSGDDDQTMARRDAIEPSVLRAAVEALNTGQPPPSQVREAADDGPTVREPRSATAAVAALRSDAVEPSPVRKLPRPNGLTGKAPLVRADTPAPMVRKDPRGMTGASPVVGRDPAEPSARRLPAPTGSGKQPVVAGDADASLRGPPPARRDGAPIDLSALAEADKTSENRGAVGATRDKLAALTSNAVSGTIGEAARPVVEGAGGQSGPVHPAVARAQPAELADDDGDSEPTLAHGPGAAKPWLSVPIGEFDGERPSHEQDKLRTAYSQATIRRADPTLGTILGELADDTGAGKPQRAGADPTLGTVLGGLGDDTRGDATADSEAAGAADGGPPTGTLHAIAMLRRRPGVFGDLRYVATVGFGLRAARRELAALELRQATRQQSRRHHLVTLGRSAVSQAESAIALAESIHPDREPAESAAHPALGPAREQLADIDEERGGYAAEVAAAEVELAELRTDRDARAKQHVADLAAIDAELAATADKLAPLDKQARRLRKRGVDHHEALRRIDARIAAAEAKLAAATGNPTADATSRKQLDPTEVQAEIATLRADRKAIESDEPAIAAELDALNPRIAALEAARGELRRKREALIEAEHEDQQRVEELRVAIGARRKVVDRSIAGTDARRDKVLFQLGERLCVDRPAALASQLAPIDQIDVELGVADRRIMELREIQSSVDRWKVARGILWLVVVIALLGGLAVGGFVAHERLLA